MRTRRQASEAQGLLFGAAVPVGYAEALYPARRIILDSGSEHWCSPVEVLDPVREFAPIAFDPFSNPYSIVGAAREIMLPEDSLLLDWPLDGLIFCNPPYGDALLDCARKIGEQAARGCEIITLVPARLDTKWWQRALRPELWCAWAGRLTFLETVVSLEARYVERVERARIAGIKPPPRPRYRRIGEHLAEGETATFAAALCYAGPRPQRFISTFAAHGELYQRLAA
jgi:hypothetical protein